MIYTRAGSVKVAVFRREWRGERREEKPMNQTIFRFTLCAVLFVLCGSVGAQQAGKIFRIGLLDPSDARSSAVRLEAFWQEIRKLGWIEGRNFAIESRFSEEKTDRLDELAADLVRLKVDVIVCASTAAALAAKRATTTIPIVMVNSADPVGAGLVASLARPGGNVTGMSGLTVELNTKRLEVLKDAVPRLMLVGIPRVTSSVAAVSDELQMKEVRVAAVALKLKLEEINIKLESKALESAFQSLKQKQVGAILVVSRRARRQVSIAGDLSSEGI